MFSVLVAAGLFSAYHHFVFVGGQLVQTSELVWQAFLFRLLAGIYFGALFAVRGFAVTAGTHAFYDIIAALINVAVTNGTS